MSGQGSSSSSSRGSGQHADACPPRHAPGPKLQVQRSLSRDTITIHFSALGKEEDDEEEELYGMPVGSAGDKSGLCGSRILQGEEAPWADEQSIATGLEAKEELLFESSGVETSLGAAVLPVSSTALSVEASDPHPHTPSPAMTIIATSTHSHLSSDPPASSSWPSDHPSASPLSTSSSSPCKSAALSSSKPFLSLVRSLSNDVESRETSPAPATLTPSHARHRHLMKSFVKSLSTDTSKTEHQEGPLHHYLHHPSQQQVQPSHRPPPRNMQLFKQFSQPRLPSCPVPVTHAGGDSKTAPSSPIMSPDGRSFFKVQEVEARIEDTKRRLSEVMSDPLQLFSKIMGDESSSGHVASATHRAKLLSSSASELTGVAAVNGHTEGNNNYSIKEEEGVEGEEEEETPTGRGHDSVFFSFPSLAPAPSLSQASSSTFSKSPSLNLVRCSMSALVARQEDEDFCELYSEDLCTDTETPDGDRSGSRQPHTGSTGLCSELDTEEEEKMEEDMETVPVTALIFLTQLVYWYLVFPVPPYVCAVVHGIVLGFALALLVLWLSSHRRSSSGTRKLRQMTEPWNVSQLDIKEPGIFKVRQSTEEMAKSGPVDIYDIQLCAVLCCFSLSLCVCPQLC